MCKKIFFQNNCGNRFLFTQLHTCSKYGMIVRFIARYFAKIVYRLCRAILWKQQNELCFLVQHFTKNILNTFYILIIVSVLRSFQDMLVFLCSIRTGIKKIFRCIFVMQMLSTQF